MNINHDIILVDENDIQIGTGEKYDIHLKGILHRAFSIFLFNRSGEMLLQRRAFSKYHSGGLWTNTCCSHPMPGELAPMAARRRLKEEMSIECDLQFIYKFIYRAELGNGLIEYELDHVFIGNYDGIVSPNQVEVADFEFKSISLLEAEVSLNPERFTVWFRIIFNELLPLFREKYGV